jgi:hypothetical protein
VVLTPEFLLWAIEYTCPIRGDQDGSDPEKVERQLRAARATSEAHQEGRVFEGVAVDIPLGFRVHDALTIYGGQSQLQQCCGPCPVNALTSLHVPATCGCYGVVPLPLDPRPVHAAIERGIEAAGSRQELATRPRWYGLWLDTPLWAELLFDTFLILEAAPIEDRDCRPAIENLMLGLNVAFNQNRKLHVRLYPPGRVEGSWWQLEPHCPRCKASWPRERSLKCEVCGYVGHSAPQQKRRAGGRRPYFPLDRLLGPEEAAAFLARYADFRARQAPPDQVQSQIPRGPPDSRPAGSGS